MLYCLQCVLMYFKWYHMLATHQWRGQSQRENLDTGIGLEDIKNYLHILHDAQTMSHIVNLVVQQIANRSGCKLEEINFHLPEWIAAEVPLSVRKAVTPWLHEATKKVRVKKEKYTNMKYLMPMCLVTAMGCLEALCLLVAKLMQFSPSYLDYSDIENVELCKHPIHSSCSQPVFSHAFLQCNIS